MSTLNVALLGAGRIGRTHAAALAGLSTVRLVAVHDPADDAAGAVMAETGARVRAPQDIMGDAAVDAVIIATPTDLHAGQIEMAARAGKAVFCEKPIDLDAGRVRACLAVVDETRTPLMVGFNRRFDPSFAEMKRRIGAGTVGAVELVQITSRDPAPPPLGYVRRSGGLFRDMMIHDFDMARFLLGEEVEEVSATGAVLVDPAIGAAGDLDTAAATLRTSSGRIAVITCSRRATYGYDQRIEVHGSAGMVSAQNQRATSLTVADGSGYRCDPALPFFMERYAQAYSAELAKFAECLAADRPLSPNGEDGLCALLLADAAEESARTGRTVRVAPHSPAT